MGDRLDTAVCVTPSAKGAEECALVLAASGIPHRLEETDAGWTVMVAAGDAARARGVTLAVRAEGSSRIAGDANLLTRAVDNLLDNAIKYSHAGSRVEVILRREDGWVALEVRDQGIGIPEEHLPRITERFYRVDPARSRELGGTGLGLAIVKHVALVHRGTLLVESHLGRGSCFTLRFPAAVDAGSRGEG